MKKPLPTYSSYLLRLWHEGDSAEVANRITLQNVVDGKQTNFTDFEHLILFLQDRNLRNGEPNELSQNE